MNPRGNRLFLLAQILSLSFAGRVATAESVPFDQRYVGLQSDGSVVVPTGQYLRPEGRQVTFPGRPTDVVVLPGKRLALVKNRGDMVLVDLGKAEVTATLEMPNRGNSWVGLSLAPDGKRFYTTDSARHIEVGAFDDAMNMRWERSIDLPGPRGADNSVPGGITLSPDGGTIYVCLSRNNVLAMVDEGSGAISATVEVGVCPFQVVLGPNRKAYVSNWGGRRPKPGDSTALSSGTEVVVDARGIASTGSVTVVDLGRLVPVAEIETDLHPCAMVLSPDRTRLYVACANSDRVSVVDTGSDQVVGRVGVQPSADLPFGSAPTGLAVSDDGTLLYATMGGNNAVAVIRLSNGTREASGAVERQERSQVIGCIPTGWYPGALALSDRGRRMVVANVKGHGSLSWRDDRRSPVTGEPVRAGNSHDHMGSVSILRIPRGRALDRATARVEENNRSSMLQEATQPPRPGVEPVPLPRRHGEPSVFKHVVYIILENRTYDQVFGDLPQGNGMPELCVFGREVTPNRHKLAEEFVLLDNTYCSGVLSADGHQWTNEGYVTDYLERAFGGFTRSYPYEGDDALAFASSGFIWDKVLDAGLSFRDYGEMVHAEIEPGGTWTDIYRDYVNGTGLFTFRANAEIARLRPHLCEGFIGFPINVPDVVRADVFLREFREFERNGNLPSFIIMLLPADHTMGTRPEYPTPRAMVADNDLALGRIIDAVSHSRFWPETCIFVIQDDPQSGWDHIDGHRTPAHCISPYTRRGAVITMLYTQLSILRSIELILGLTPMNQLDATATAMWDCFTEDPDLTPYTAEPNRIPLDEMNPPKTSLQGSALRWCEESLAQNLDELDQADEDTLNRIIWHSVKGYGTPYPVAYAGSPFADEEDDED